MTQTATVTDLSPSSTGARALLEIRSVAKRFGATEVLRDISPDMAQGEFLTVLAASYWQTFWRVTIPNLRLSIIGAALLIFTLSMDEIAVSFFLIGRSNTLPLEIWSRLRRGMTPEINAVSTLVFFFSLVTILLWYRLRVRGRRTVVAEEIA